MAINWNQAEYVAPKLQIVPEQLPLEAGIKVGTVLQDRFDKAIETDTKIGALAKKLRGSVDKSDQALAEEIMSIYSTRLKDRATSGDYHKMQWQTLADAEDFANIYTGLTSKAKELDSYRKSIINDKSINPETKEKWLKMYNSKLTPASFDKENRFISNLNINTPSVASDIDPVAFVNTLGSGWQADSFTGQSATYKISDGKIKLPGMKDPLPAGIGLKYTEGKGWQKVDTKELDYALNQAFKSSIPFNSMIDRDVELSLFENPLQQGETLESRKSQIFNNYVNPAVSFAKNKFGYTSTTEKNDVDINEGLTNVMTMSKPSNFKADVDAALTGIYNDIDVTKSVEEIENEAKKTSKNFDANGKYTGKPKSYSERVGGVEGALENPLSAVEQLTIAGDMKDMTLPVAPYFEKLYRKGPNNKDRTDKEIFDTYIALMKNNAKIANLDYNLASAKFRETVDKNIFATISGMPLLNKNLEPLNNETSKKIMSDPNKTTKYNLYNGTIKITGAGNEAITPLSSLGKGKPNEANIQKQLSAYQQILKSALDVSKDSEGVYDVPSVEGNIHYRVSKPGVLGNKQGMIQKFKDENGKSILLENYPLNEQGISNFTKEAISTVIADSNLGME
jgi:hypothetical protein